MKPCCSRGGRVYGYLHASRHNVLHHRLAERAGASGWFSKLIRRNCSFQLDPSDPPRAYAPLICRCLTLFDGQRRMTIVNYPFNCLDVATPILRVRCEKELGIAPAYLVLLATHNHQSPIRIVRENFDYGRELAEKSSRQSAKRSAIKKVR